MNRTLLRIILALSILVVVALVAWRLLSTPPGSDSSPEALSVRLPIPVVDTAFSPFYLAIDDGYYADKGLEVTLQPGTPELNPVKMLALGEDDFAVLGGPELLLTGSQRAPLVGIALVHRNSDFVVLVVPEESSIRKVQDLQGQRVGFFYGHISTDILRMLFQKTSVTVVEEDVGFNYSRLLSGDLAAQWAFRTTAGINLPEQGIPVRFISPADYGIKTNGHVIVTTQEMIDEHPGIVQRFLEATLQGMRRAIDDPDAAVAAAVNRDPDFSEEVGRKQMRIYVPAMAENRALGWFAVADLLVARDQMAEIGLIDRDYDVTTAIDTTALRGIHNQ